MSYYILPKTNKGTPSINPIFYERQCDAEIYVISNSVKLRREILLNQIGCSRKLQPKSCFKKYAEPPPPVALLPLLPLALEDTTNRTGLLADLIEITNSFNISDVIKLNRPFKFLNFSLLSVQDIHHIVKSGVKITSPKNTMQSYSLDQDNLSEHNAMFFDCWSPNYSCDLICALFIILCSLSTGGMAIIKVSSITFQLELDVLYILNHAFDKVYILKPDSSNATNDDKYVICKHFSQKPELTAQIAPVLLACASATKENKYIGKLLLHKLPCTFLVKMEEINVIIGQKQMDGLSLLINPVKRKSSDDQWHKIRQNASI